MLCMCHHCHCTPALQISVGVATLGRRLLMRKDFGMQPIKVIPASPASARPAFHVGHKRRKGSLPADDPDAYRRESRRRLTVNPCDPATSAVTYGDINFDCQFTFVQVCCCTRADCCILPCAGLSVGSLTALPSGYGLHEDVMRLSASMHAIAEILNINSPMQADAPRKHKTLL